MQIKSSDAMRLAALSEEGADVRFLQESLEGLGFSPEVAEDIIAESQALAGPEPNECYEAFLEAIRSHAVLLP